MLKAPQTIFADEHLPAPHNSPENTYDPELLYVECSRCGQPVIWEQGRTTELVRKAGLAHSHLDARYMVLTDGCPSCSPEEIYFETRVVRLVPAHDEFEDYKGAVGSA